MNAVTMEVAQTAKLSDLIERLKPNEEVDRAVAKKVSERKPRVFGLGKGKLVIVRDDDEPSKDFEEYMP